MDTFQFFTVRIEKILKKHKHFSPLPLYSEGNTFNGVLKNTVKKIFKLKRYFNLKLEVKYWMQTKQKNGFHFFWIYHWKILLLCNYFNNKVISIIIITLGMQKHKALFKLFKVINIIIITLGMQKHKTLFKLFKVLV